MASINVVLALGMWLKKSEDCISALGYTVKTKQSDEKNQAALELSGGVLASIGVWGREGSLDLDYLLPTEAAGRTAYFHFDTEKELHQALDECLVIISSVG